MSSNYALTKIFRIKKAAISREANTKISILIKFQSKFECKIHSYYTKMLFGTVRKQSKNIINVKIC